MMRLLLLVAVLLLSACNESTTPPPAQTTWRLTLVFACPAEDGCGEPPKVTLPEVYDAKTKCDAAGANWMKPAANPTGALASVSCGG